MSANVRTGRALSRRTLLRGAGATIALPFLSAMLPAGHTSAATPRSRFACVYIPHGAVMRQWLAPSDGQRLELGPILRSLEPFRSQLNVVSDLTLPLAYGEDASAGANHTRSSAVWITCAKPEASATPRLGVSADQVAAEVIGQDTPLPSLELSLEEGGLSGGSGLSGAYRNTIAWRTPTAPLPMEMNPQVVFERLFGDGATVAERAKRREVSASLLDSVLEDAAALARTLPADDRVRLERHFEDVREVERRIELAGSKGADLDVPVRPTGVPDDFEQHAKLMFDLLALAWAADLTRVGTLMIAKEVSNAVYPASGINDPFHNLSHHSEVPANIERYARLNAYHTSTTLAYFLAKLRDTPDADGTLLDHSLVLYGSGMSNSNQHDHEPLPTIVAGGASGALIGARHVRAGAGTPMANLLVALLHKLGVDADRFGDSTGVVSI
jgi:hypothetical protein